MESSKITKEECNIIQNQIKDKDDLIIKEYGEEIYQQICNIGETVVRTHLGDYGLYAYYHSIACNIIINRYETKKLSPMRNVAIAIMFAIEEFLRRDGYSLADSQGHPIN